MPIINTLNVHEFIDGFHRMGRGDQFSRDALEWLFEYYDEIDGFEYDPIGICCDWGEYSTEEELNADYTQHDGNARKILEDNGVLFALPSGGFLIQAH